MKYSEYKKARKFGKDKENETLLSRIAECEDILGVCDWLKGNENKDKEGKPRYKATITLNLHGRGEEDSDETSVRSVTYDSNFDYIEKKARGMYDRLIKEFESKTE